ncbi:MAG: AsmA family protein, partial [Pseudomonadales bacterium]|nr:AsmA family protein [Pseudomonadales bacterium]
DIQIAAGLGLVELDPDTLAGRLSGLAATATGFDSEIVLNAAGEFGIPDSQLSGDVEIRKVGLRKLMSALGITDRHPADEKALTSLTGSLLWSAGSDHLTLEDVRLRLDDSELTGNAAIQGFETPATRFDLELDRIDVDRYLSAPAASTAGGGSPEPTLVPFDTLNGLNVDGRLLIRKLKASTLELADVKLGVSEKGGGVALTVGGKGAGGTFLLEGRGDVAAAEPALGGTLDLQALSPRKLLQAFDADTATADPGALSALSGTTRWRLGSRNLSLEQMDWRLDQSNITGAVTVDNFDKQALRFDLSLDRMNLDNYLAPDTASSADAGLSEEAAFEIPVELIRNLRLDGKLTAGQISVAMLILQNLSARVQAADGILRLDPLQASLYGGSYRGTIQIDATGAKARLTLDQQISAVQVAEVLKNLYDSDRLAGALTLQLAGTGTGNTRAELLKALTGNVSMSLSDGVYRGMDLVYEVQRAQSLLRQTPLPAVPEQKVTAIRALSFAGRMVDGVLGTDQLSAEIPYLRLAGKGGVNLVDLALDYQLNAQVQRGTDTTAASSLNELVNTTIPLTIKGPMASPRVGVDLKNLVSTTVRDTVQERARHALLKRLGGTKETAEPTTTVAGERAQQATASDSAGEPEEEHDGDQAGTSTPESGSAPAPAQPVPAESRPASTKDLLKRGLKDLLKPPPTVPAPAPD